jgi:hypothetical protein
MDSALWQTVIGVLVALGGGGGIVFALSGWLGRVWADRVAEQLKASNTQALERIKADFVRDVESYKVRLKKSEFFFQREFDATLEFTSIVRSVIPRRSFPDMDWSDAMEQVVDSFAKTERRLEDFLVSHGPVLSEGERELLDGAISTATEGKLYGSAEGDPAGHKLAATLCKTLKELESHLIKRLRDQSSL